MKTLFSRDTSKGGSVQCSQNLRLTPFDLEPNCHVRDLRYEEPGVTVISVQQLKAGEQTALLPLPSEPNRADLWKQRSERSTRTDLWGYGGACCYEMVLG